VVYAGFILPSGREIDGGSGFEDAEGERLGEMSSTDVLS
jgi:hypothetical protein